MNWLEYTGIRLESSLQKSRLFGKKLRENRKTIRKTVATICQKINFWKVWQISAEKWINLNISVQKQFAKCICEKTARKIENQNVKLSPQYVRRLISEKFGEIFWEIIEILLPNVFHQSSESTSQKLIKSLTKVLQVPKSALHGQRHFWPPRMNNWARRF